MRTYPQLWSKSVLLGGGDFVKALAGPPAPLYPLYHPSTGAGAIALSVSPTRLLHGFSGIKSHPIGSIRITNENVKCGGMKPQGSQCGRVRLGLPKLSCSGPTLGYTLGVWDDLIPDLIPRAHPSFFWPKCFACSIWDQTNRAVQPALRTPPRIRNRPLLSTTVRIGWVYHRAFPYSVAR